MGPDPGLTQAINAAAGEIAASQKFTIDNAKYLDDAEKRHLDALVTDIRGAQSLAAVGAKRQDLDRTLTELRTKSGERRKDEEDRLVQQRKDQEALQARAARNKALADAVARATPVFSEAEPLEPSSSKADGEKEGAR